MKKLGEVSSKLFESCMEAGGLFMVAVITAVAISIATQHTPFRVWRHAPPRKVLKSRCYEIESGGTFCLLKYCKSFRYNITYNESFHYSYDIIITTSLETMMIFNLVIYS